MLKKALFTLVMAIALLITSVKFIHLSPDYDTSKFGTICTELSMPYIRQGGFPIGVYSYDICGSASIVPQKLGIDFLFWILVSSSTFWVANYLQAKRKST